MIRVPRALYVAAKSKQISRIREADAELATLRWFLRQAEEKPLKIITKSQHETVGVMLAEVGSMLGDWMKKVSGGKHGLGDMPPCNPSSRSADSFLAYERVVFRYKSKRLTFVASSPNNSNIMLGQLGATIPRSFGVISGVLKSVFDVFLYRAVFQVVQSVVQGIPVKVAHNLRAWTNASPALKHEAVNGYQFGLLVLSDSAFLVRRGVINFHRKLRDFLPIVSARLWAGSRVSGRANGRPRKDSAIFGCGVKAELGVATYFNGLFVNRNNHIHLSHCM